MRTYARLHLLVPAALFGFGATAGVQAQESPAAAKMTFFITSAGTGNGANLGGLEGADAHCQTLAEAVGAAGRTWRAYLSTSGEGAVNVRDRIGAGPWMNAKGVQIAASVEELHGGQQRQQGNRAQ
jgi:hypothetical protein